MYHVNEYPDSQIPTFAAFNVEPAKPQIFILFFYFFSTIQPRLLSPTNSESGEGLGTKMVYSRDAEAGLELEESSSSSEMSSEDEAEIRKPGLKRRRTSESSDDSFVVPQPLPTPSRIKEKKQNGEGEKQEADPVTVRDVLAAGVQNPDSSFASLDLSPWLVGSLSAMAIKIPTAIQKACIPEILKGNDCIGGSRTGSGKTVAFAAPILQKWSEDPFGIFALILTPTR
jgi:ATP-dependent RNA helicase DDX49/DBP8